MTELINDPQEINKLAEAFQTVSQDVNVTTEPPANNIVNLPGGYIFKDGSVGTTAEVRELNGFDEEALAKANSINSALKIIFERGLVSVADETLSKSDLDSMLMGDRDAILLAIRSITFGQFVDVDVVCNSCNTSQSLEIDLTNDIPVKTLDDRVNDRLITVELKSGVAEVVLPNLITNKRLMDIPNATYAETLTEILAGCLVSVNNSHSLGKITAQQLGLSDREAIASALYDGAPGPRLAEVSKACEACDNNIKISLGLASLFRL